MFDTYAQHNVVPLRLTNMFPTELDANTQCTLRVMVRLFGWAAVMAEVSRIQTEIDNG